MWFVAVLIPCDSRELEQPLSCLMHGNAQVPAADAAFFMEYKT
nr:MAG TPA: hypothetical protein [Caudoviricetes sp.]